ncbi:MAG: PIN domain-containing protein [Leptospiraceae bacterium]|nr:PIN domain-containing protein [Leptospiraceae bacterium]
MKDRVFVDSDVILDVVIGRERFYESSALFLSLVENRNILGFTSPIVISNIHYIARKELKNATKAKSIIKTIMEILSVLSVNETNLETALNQDFPDFEDSIQYTIAIENKIDTIVTRNTKDYKRSKLKVFTPEDYLLANASRVIV